MSKQLLRDHASKTMEQIRMSPSLPPHTPAVQPPPLVQDNSARENALQEQIRSLQAQLQAIRDTSAREIGRAQEDKARVERELQAKVISELQAKEENDQLKLQIASMQEVLNHPVLEQKVQTSSPPAYYETRELKVEHTAIEQDEVDTLGELPTNTADLD